MQGQERIDEMMRELRRFKQELPGWANVLAGQEATGEGGRGRAVRAHCDISGNVSRVEIDSNYLRAVQPSQVESAILEALQNAEKEASRMVSDHQESLQFMGVPIGEVMSGKRSLEDVLPMPPSLVKYRRTSEEER